MTGATRLPLLFLDVDGPLLPYGAAAPRFPTGGAPGESLWDDPDPFLTRLDPAHGPRLLALPCELVWATAWEKVPPLHLRPDLRECPEVVGYATPCTRPV